MVIYIIYLIYLMIITLLYRSKKKNNPKTYLIFSFVPLILIAGCRATTVGIDTQQFVDAFYGIIKRTPSQFSELRYEYGFSYLCWILGKISKEPNILIFATSLFINISVARFIYKNSDNITISVILYFLGNFFFSYMNIMRQALAIAIILWGYEYLKQNKYVKFSIFVIVASFFHGTAFLALILILLKKINYNKNFLFMVITFSVLSFFFGKNIFLILSKFSSRLLKYAGGRFDVENYFAALLNFVVYLVSYIFGFMCIYKNELKTKNNDMIGIMGMAVVCSSLTMKVSLFNRFTPYFSIFIIIWLANAICEIKNRNNKRVYKIIIIILFLLYWSIILMLRPEWYGVVPYKFY